MEKNFLKEKRAREKEESPDEIEKDILSSEFKGNDNSEYDKLVTLKRLLEEGLITQEEYDNKRKEIINKI